MARIIFGLILLAFFSLGELPSAQGLTDLVLAGRILLWRLPSTFRASFRLVVCFCNIACNFRNFSNNGRRRMGRRRRMLSCSSNGFGARQHQVRFAAWVSSGFKVEWQRGETFTSFPPRGLKASGDLENVQKNANFMKFCTSSVSRARESQYCTTFCIIHRRRSCCLVQDVLR